MMRHSVLFLTCVATLQAPAIDCSDPAWASREAHQPIYNNQILTKAITYAVEWPGSPTLPRSRKLQVESDIDRALQSALTEWGASLLAIRKSLDPHLTAYLESALFCQPGSCQYNAPPAVRVSCRQNASLVFLVYATGGDPFPDKEDGALARAQTQGRTILLNLDSFSFTYDQFLFAVLNEDGVINLTAVIAHELGHSFGLSHAAPGEPSIMLAALSGTTVARFPTARDGRKFAAILGEFVQGSKPGEFEAVQCQGLRVSPQ
jgi:hypothetical protein